MKKYIFWAVLLSFISTFAQAQVTPGVSAATLATTLAGSGISISSPTLNCPGQAAATFNMGTSLSFSNGIVLTNGRAIDAFNPASSFASVSNGTGGDGDLTTLAGQPTYDACVLEFDFVPVTNVVRVNYVFGSEEYTNYTCSHYNDVFGFFISGPGIGGTPNMATVPGTGIPVCINSINCGATGGYAQATCDALTGPGSPYCGFYINNAGGGTIAYDGLTRTLVAQHAVIPCSTYHMKIGIADAADRILDAGVFLKAGSFSSGGGAAATISGTYTVCVGGVTHLTATGGSGSWSSLNTGVATVNSSGDVFGVSPGTATIVYGMESPCGPIGPSVVVTVQPIPDAGTAYCPGNICANDPVSWICGVSGNNVPGTWSLTGGGPDVSINSGGGLTINPYMTTPRTVTACFTVSTPCGWDQDCCTFTVYPNPQFTVTGNGATVCSGDPFTFGINFTWPYSAPGHTYSWSTGATTPSITNTHTTPYGMSYVYSVTVTNSYGCSTDTWCYINVDPDPDAGVVHCPGNFCAADPISYICSVTGNNAPGTWSLTGGGPDVTIFSGGGLWVNPAMKVPRTVTVYYTVTNSCGTDVASCTFTVYPNPQMTITPPFTICSGNPFTLGVTFTPPYTAPGHTYSWSTGSTTPTITQTPSTYWGISMVYSVTVTNSWGCSTMANTYVNIDPEPYAGIISCPGNFCAADPISYICSITGNNGPGTWSLTGGGPDVTIYPGGGLWVNPAMLVPRTVTVSYTVTNSCGTDVASCTFTVYPNPPITITGPTSGCHMVPFTLGVAFTSPYTAPSHTYLWNNGATTNPMTDAKASGVSWLYTVTVTNSWGCSSSASHGISIHPKPYVAFEVFPNPVLCVGQTTTAMAFGSGVGAYTSTWSATPPGIVSLSSPGLTTITLTGLSAGTATLSYTATSSFGCSSSTTTIVTVNPAPGAITGPTTVCTGSTITLNQTVPGGLWSSSSSSVATVASAGLNGIVTGVSPGTVTISYSTGGTCSAVYIVTVIAAPTPSIKKCPTDMCEGNSQFVGGNPAYSSYPYTVNWSAAPPLMLSGGSAAGVTITGMSAGGAILTYEVTDVTTGCTGYAYCHINIWPAPPPLAGPTDICEGQTTTLTGTPPGGMWISTNAAVGTVDPTGVVTGISGGTVTIDYILPPPMNDCYSEIVVNVVGRATACVQWAFDPGCSCNAFIFTGTPGANANYEVYDCGGTLIHTGSVMLDPSGNGVVYNSGLPPGACRLCITSVDYMGCSWPCSCPPGSPGRCCANVGAPRMANTTGVAETEHVHAHLEVVPNPNRGDFILKGDILTSHDVQIEVFDVVGQSVYSAKVSAKEHNINHAIVLADNIANGVYLIKISNTEVNEVLRFALRR